MTDEQYKTHRWLNKAYMMRKQELATKEEARDKAFSDLAKGSKSYDEIDVQQTKKNSQEERQHLYDDLEAEIVRLKEEIAKEKRLRIKIINHLKSDMQRVVMIERYINQKSFFQIGKLLNYSERHVQRIRLQALDNIKEFIPEEE